jgi:transcriptional regulator with XRE-family HTH domain
MLANGTVVMAKSANSIDKHIGMRVRRTREFREMSQEVFAAELGLSLHQVKKFESGFERIGASQLAAICKSLRVRPSFFFADLKMKGVSKTANRRVNGGSSGVNMETAKDLSAALAALAEEETLRTSPIFDLLRKLEAELRAGRPLAEFPAAHDHEAPDASAL